MEDHDRRMHGPLGPRCRVLRFRQEGHGPPDGCRLGAFRILGIMGQALRRCRQPSRRQPRADKIRGAMRQEPHPYLRELQRQDRGRRGERDPGTTRRRRPGIDGRDRQERDDGRRHPMRHRPRDPSDGRAVQGLRGEARSPLGAGQHPRMRPRGDEMGAPRTRNCGRMLCEETFAERGVEGGLRHPPRHGRQEGGPPPRVGLLSGMPLFEGLPPPSPRDLPLRGAGRQRWWTSSPVSTRRSAP